jgi:hypothetical protein
VGSGEQWITELDSGALRELFALSEGAQALADNDGEDDLAVLPVRPPAKQRARRRSAEVP